MKKADYIGIVGGILIASIVIALAKEIGLILGFVPAVLLVLGGYWLTKTIANRIISDKEEPIGPVIKEEEEEMSQDVKDALNNMALKTEELKRKLNKEPKENIWSKFKGKPNKKGLLKGKATFLMPLLVENSIGLASFITDYSKIQGKEKILVWESFAFFLHLVERISLEYLNPEDSEYFCKELIDLIAIDNIANYLKQGRDPTKIAKMKEDSKNYLTSRWLSTKAEYFEFSNLLPANPREGFADSLFWHFGSKITEILLGHPEDAVICFAVLICCTKSYISLQLHNLFREE
ncbi:MAG: hypothetical protein U9R38_07730 [Candidatus Margulisiibacteriota bacterium]|nr:hypothetical protein [Candidatus Margulisiibacteriota bacterium]